MIYDLGEILHLREFVLTLQSLVWVVFYHFPLTDATDIDIISSNKHRLLFDVSLCRLSFFVNTSLKEIGSIVQRPNLKNCLKFGPALKPCSLWFTSATQFKFCKFSIMKFDAKNGHLHKIIQGNKARKFNCYCVFSAYIVKPVLFGRYL